MPNEQPKNPVRKVGEWMAGHRSILYVVFLALAGLNVWASWHWFVTAPWWAIPNFLMAALLVIFVISTWHME